MLQKKFLIPTLYISLLLLTSEIAVTEGLDKGTPSHFAGGKAVLLGTPLSEDSAQEFIRNGLQICLAKLRERETSEEILSEKLKYQMCYCMASKSAELLTVEDFEYAWLKKDYSRFEAIGSLSAEQCLVKYEKNLNSTNALKTQDIFINKEAFKNITVEVACYKKKNPKASREEAAQALLKIAKDQGIDTTDPQKFALAYMSSMKDYAKDMNYLAEIGKAAQAKGCQ